jgi:prepilin-type N-terminal cleavage/methylation domain-containing protein
VHTRERGFTLIEVVIGVAIIAMTVAAGITLSLASQPAAVSMTAARFDALLDAARTEARAYDTGVTIAFTATDVASVASGFRARLYRGRPVVGPLTALNFPGIDATVGVNESTSLRTPAFALTVHGDGYVSGIVGYIPSGSSSSPETACPASGAYHFVFSGAGRQAERYVPCVISRAATGPISYATLAPGNGSVTPPPGGCVSVTCATTPPVQTSTCPPLSFLAGGGCIESPLVVNPTAIVIPRPGAAAVPLTATEAHYSGPLQITSVSCAPNAVTVSGGGTGPNTTFSVTSAQPGICSIAIADDHGDAQTISVTTYGPLTVSPASLVFSSSTAAAQTITAHEDYYLGVISADLTTPDSQGDPGCSPYAWINPSVQSTNSSWSAVFSTSPQRALIGRCEVTFIDDHGGIAQEQVEVLNPTIACSDGTVVGLGTPCPPSVILNIGVLAQLTVDCPYNPSDGTMNAGPATLRISQPSSAMTSTDFDPSQSSSQFFALASFTVSTTAPVSFSATGDGGAALAIGIGANASNGTPLSSGPWIPPAPGQYTIGMEQAWDDGGMCGGAGSGVTNGTVWTWAGTLVATQ